MFRRLFSSPQPEPEPEPELVPRPTAPDSDTETIRRIAAQLQELPMERRRFIGGFAYVLGRAANADLSITPDEVAFIERTIVEVGQLPEAQAVLVVEIARAQTELKGATEDYLVTREFTEGASVEDRQRLLRFAFAVTASDDTITAQESAELNEIGKELGFTSGEVDKVRVDFADQLSAIQAMRRATAG
ncbi:MAG: TerB family tellurite resistance protein [Candidatus Limnocylindrales bacterium]